ncbi:hypothetical protein [Nostoc sp. LEGE 12450]|uniref:hypothetical protein n=1 Tax=Nostoc sp. LEGE 12450 TaxID=1828643 RepID=UPI00187E7935|nr:hypothetical protein [Nostoc sp. LEGE 12450]MBE8987789.1 hypothetical protein [Nostoc sp. LEGE 12450]
MRDNNSTTAALSLHTLFLAKVLLITLLLIVTELPINSSVFLAISDVLLIVGFALKKLQLLTNRAIATRKISTPA